MERTSCRVEPKFRGMEQTFHPVECGVCQRRVQKNIRVDGQPVRAAVRGKTVRDRDFCAESTGE